MSRRTKRTKNLKNVFIAKIGKKTYSNINEINREQERIKNLRNKKPWNNSQSADEANLIPTLINHSIDKTEQPKGNFSELKITDQIILTSKILRKLGLKMTYQDEDFLKDKKYK